MKFFLKCVLMMPLYLSMNLSAFTIQSVLGPGREIAIKERSSRTIKISEEGGEGIDFKTWAKDLHYHDNTVMLSTSQWKNESSLCLTASIGRQSHYEDVDNESAVELQECSKNFDNLSQMWVVLTSNIAGYSSHKGTGFQLKNLGSGDCLKSSYVDNKSNSASVFLSQCSENAGKQRFTISGDISENPLDYIAVENSFTTISRYADKAAGCFIETGCEFGPAFYLISENKKYWLWFQDDGNFVCYKNFGDKKNVYDTCSHIDFLKPGDSDFKHQKMRLRFCNENNELEIYQCFDKTSSRGKRNIKVWPKSKNIKKATTPGCAHLVLHNNGEIEILDKNTKEVYYKFQ